MNEGHKLKIRRGCYRAKVRSSLTGGYCGCQGCRLRAGGLAAAGVREWLGASGAGVSGVLFQGQAHPHLSFFPFLPHPVGIRAFSSSSCWDSGMQRFSSQLQFSCFSPTKAHTRLPPFTRLLHPFTLHRQPSQFSAVGNCPSSLPVTQLF